MAFRRVLESLVPHAAERSGHELAAALRAAGIDPPLAAHAARLRDRLSNAVYGPDRFADSDELGREVAEVISALTADDREVTSRVAMVSLLICLFGVGPADAQSAESLFQAGAWRTAADSFAARAAAAPLVAEHWYNLGNALAAADQSVHAQVAWIRASRLAPRHATIRAAIREAVTGGVIRRPETVWVAPITPGEAFAAAMLLWVLGWALAVSKRRRRVWIPLVVAAVAVAAVGYGIRHRYAAPVALVVHDGAGLREAPVGPSPITVRLEPGTPVRVERESGSWVLVRVGPDRGWILGSALAHL